MEEVPRRTSLASHAPPCFVLCLLWAETEGLLDYQGITGALQPDSECEQVRKHSRMGSRGLPDRGVKIRKEFKIKFKNLRKSGKKKEPKPKLFGPDILGWGGGLSREGVGAEKFGMSLETRETKFFWRDIPGFCRESRRCPKSLRKKRLCSNFVP